MSRPGKALRRRAGPGTAGRFAVVQGEPLGARERRPVRTGRCPAGCGTTCACARQQAAQFAETAAEAVAADSLVVLCLLDDASAEEALSGADVTGRYFVKRVRLL